MKVVKIVTMVLALNLFSMLAQAKIGDVPSDLTKLSGAFVGKTSSTHQKVRALIIPKTQKPGTFIVALLIGDPQDIIFDGELISGSQNIGLSSLGLSQDGSEVEVTVPPTALMQVVYYAQGQADHIEIVPQAGGQVMNESVILDTQARDVSFVAPPVGEYGTREDHVSVEPEGHVKAQIAGLRLNGQFMSTLDVANIGVLRGESFDANYQSRESDKVSGLIIGLVEGGRTTLIISSPSQDGKPAHVMMLKKN